ncbi:BQ5605_C004g03066 [Microbotryum silenes-dioicae]|uniref:BQ5605_C004g03058 protein n=1 Tax=Microbotryum silenes-dioicae TaxID=796604 RepID=A0A2X0ME60_9BASI|nr:BQ5605_C004g03058 [Microbotryum silenes-dioicae]SGY69820.1 BQ5605_C004g03066 [Microbotryum silenes-dioicae]
MLLLWSRLAALALVASLATCFPLTASPLKALDNDRSFDPAPGSEAVADFTKQNISGSPIPDFRHPSTLTKDVSHLAPLALRPRETYRPGDTVTYRWTPTHSPAKADLWLTCRGSTDWETSAIDYDIPLYTGGTTTTIPNDILWADLTGDEGANANVSAFFYFGVSPDKYAQDQGVFGKHTHPFIIKKN